MASLDLLTPPAELPPLRILAVDDNESIRAFLVHFFRMENMPVEIHESSRAALERFRAAPQEYSLLLTDCEMPGLTGLELARQMRMVREDIPMIIFSTSVSIQGPEPFLKFGFMAALPKPVALDKLRVALRNALACPPPATPARPAPQP